jgi:hypothetical protein
MHGKSPSHDDWKSIRGFADDFMGRADKRDRSRIVWHDLICRRGGLLAAFFVVPLQKA